MPSFAPVIEINAPSFTWRIKFIPTLENVDPWFFNKKQEFFLKSIHCKSADIFPVQKLQIELIDSTNLTIAV